MHRHPVPPGRRRVAAFHQLLSAGLLLGCSLAAGATAWQPHESLREAAADFLGRQTADSAIAPRISVARPDPRLRLAACELPLETFLPPGARPAGHLAVGVRCSGARPWTVYLPASVREFREVVVLTRPVPRGGRLAAEDLRVEVRDTSALGSGFLTRTEPIVGLLAGRPLAAGSVLAESMLEAPRLVQRGQQVVLVARAGGLEVRSAGKALEDGAEGELVRVRNSRSSRVVQARVTAAGTVAVVF